MMMLALILANWVLKAVMSYWAYMLAIWLNLPEWGVIAMVAFVAVESKIAFRSETTVR